MPFQSGLPAVDAYIADGFDQVRGMSSAFAATICGFLMRRQTEAGIAGGVLEIGAFQGRFFIALALGLRPGERGLAVDLFDWPHDRIEAIFRENCARFGLAPDHQIALRASSADLQPDQVLAALGGPARLVHIDGEHAREALTRDLDLALAVLHERGLIVLDDMLHPGYPLLMVAVHAWLERHPDMRVLLVIDRQDIVAAAKFVLCRAETVALFEQDLMASFPEQHFILGSEFESYFCVVLTPHPRLAECD